MKKLILLLPYSVTRDLCVCVLCHFSHIQLFTTLRSVVHQAPLPRGFPGKNTGMGCHALLQRIFLTQGSNLGLLHCRQILYHLSYKEVLMLI